MLLERRCKELRESKALTKAQLRKRRERTEQALRFLIQLLFFLTMPGAFVAGFTGVKYLFNSLNQGAVLEMNGFLKSLIFLLEFTLLFGRFFCGYACAFGTAGDFIHGVSAFVQKKIFKRKKVFRIPDKVVLVLQKLKYLNLIVIIGLCTFGVYSSVKGTSVWDVFSRLVRGQGIPDGYTAGVILLLLVALGMALEERFFCQFLCPMGALFALLPVFPFTSLKRKEENCAKNCKICLSSCPAHLKLAADGKRIGECISCGKCQRACPKGNISSSFGKIYRKEIIGILLKTVIFFVLGTLSGF